MSESKHTSGPWRADDNGDGTHCITAGRGCDVADTRSANNEEANARLIASAPDMREALIAAERILRAYIPEDRFDGHASAALRQVQQAIAKTNV